MRLYLRGHIALKLTLPVLFLTYMGSITLFPHAHKVGDITIVHSHPFGSEGHEHSQNELNTISMLSVFYSEGGITHIDVPEKVSVLEARFPDPELPDKLCPAFIHCDRLRGPPVIPA